MADRTPSKKAKKYGGPPTVRRSATTAERIKDMLYLCVTLEDISGRLGISIPILRKLYGKEIEEAELQHGRKPHIRTRQTSDMIRFASAIGMPKDSMAALLRTTAPVIEAEYEDEIRIGKAEGLLKVAGNLFKKAASSKDTKGGIIAAMFFLKAQHGWKETDRRELTDGDGQPLQGNQTAVVILPSNGRGDEAITDGSGGN